MIPPEIQEKLSNSEEEYFKKHSARLKEYMSKLELDLTVVISNTELYNNTFFLRLQLKFLRLNFPSLSLAGYGAT